MEIWAVQILENKFSRNASSGKCNFGQMNIRANVISGKCMCKKM